MMNLFELNMNNDNHHHHHHHNQIHLIDHHRQQQHLEHSQHLSHRQQQEQNLLNTSNQSLLSLPIITPTPATTTNSASIIDHNNNNIINNNLNYYQQQQQQLQLQKQFNNCSNINNINNNNQYQISATELNTNLSLLYADYIKKHYQCYDLNNTVESLKLLSVPSGPLINPSLSIICDNNNNNNNSKMDNQKSHTNNDNDNNNKSTISNFINVFQQQQQQHQESNNIHHQQQQLSSLDMNDLNKCLLNLIHQQADLHFQQLLKRYEIYLTSTIEQCLNSVRSADQIVAAATAAAARAAATAAVASTTVTTPTSSTSTATLPKPSMISTLTSAHNLEKKQDLSFNDDSITQSKLSGHYSNDNNNHQQQQQHYYPNQSIATLSKTIESNSIINDIVINNNSDNNDNNNDHNHKLMMMNQAINESINVVAQYNWSKIIQQQQQQHHKQSLLLLPPPPPSSLSPTETSSSSSSLSSLSTSSLSLMIGSSSSSSSSSTPTPTTSASFMQSSKLTMLPSSSANHKNNNDIQNIKTIKIINKDLITNTKNIDEDDKVIVDDNIDDNIDKNHDNDDDDDDDVDVVIVEDDEAIEDDCMMNDEAPFRREYNDNFNNNLNSDKFPNQHIIIDLKDQQNNQIININNSNSNDNHNKTITLLNNNNINNVIVEKYYCDWPDCQCYFQSEQSLNHHRHFHIRKSNYQCKHCSQRLLDRRELLEHVANCKSTLLMNQSNKSIQSQQHSIDSIRNNCSKNNENFRINYNQFRSSLTDDVVGIGDNNHLSKKLPNLSSSGSQPTTKLSKIDLNDRKSLIDQLISPRMTKNRELKKALLAIKSENPLPPVTPPTPMEMEKLELQSQNFNDQQYKRTRYSGVGRYRCPWPDCSYTPHFLRDLRRHMFKHTGDKRYKCSQCRFVSVWKTSLLQHQRKKHSMLPSSTTSSSSSLSPTLSSTLSPSISATSNKTTLLTSTQPSSTTSITSKSLTNKVTINCNDIDNDRSDQRLQ